MSTNVIVFLGDEGYIILWGDYTARGVSPADKVTKFSCNIIALCSNSYKMKSETFTGDVKVC